jgi:hypothetical protein
MNTDRAVEVGDLDRAVRSSQAEAFRWAYVDGLADFSVGFVFLAIALLAAVEARLPEGSPWAGLMALGLPVVILAAILLGRVVTPWWRQRVTYARMGYVALRQPHPGRTRSLAFVLGGTLAALVSLAIAKAPGILDWMYLLQGVSVGALLALIGWKGQAYRFLLFAALAAGVGAVVTVRAPSELDGNAWFYGTLAAVLLASGAITLLGFLRNTTPREA